MVVDACQDGKYGSEFELSALSAVLNTSIKVYQAAGLIIVYEEGNPGLDTKILQISYLREVKHYCSLGPATEADDVYDMFFTSLKSKGKKKRVPNKIWMRIEEAQTKTEKLLREIETKEGDQDDIKTIIMGLEEALAMGIQKMRVNSDLKCLVTQLDKPHKRGSRSESGRK